MYLCTQLSSSNGRFVWLSTKPIRRSQRYRSTFQLTRSGTELAGIGFVNERRKEDDPSSNDASEDFTSNVLLTTTDARGPKANQIKAFGDKGCPCEISWWMAPVCMSPPSYSLGNVLPIEKESLPRSTR